MRKKNVILLAVTAGLFGVAAYLMSGNFREMREEKARIEALRGGERGPVDLNSAPQRHRSNVLIREIMRQALFLAEREDRGLATRDATLGEATQDVRGPARGLIVHAYVRGFDGVQVQLFRDEAMTADGEPLPAENPVPATAARPMLFQTIVPMYGGDKIDHVGLVEKAERFSRNEFAAQLGTMVATAPLVTRAPADGAATSAAGLEKRLGEMNYISQYAAVRAAHRAARGSGSKADALGALARGYANLGPLTRFHWTASAKAFAARGLLYAQRMVVDAGDEQKAPGAVARALRHRAYALALAGLQGPALADLDRADKLEPPTGEQAGWLAVLRPYCLYQPGKLAEVAGARPAEAPLALFLCFLSVERGNSASVTIGYGQAALTASQDCLRVVDAMSAVAGVSANHVLTEASPAVLAESIVRRMLLIPDLPADVRAAVAAAVKADFAPAYAARIPAALIAAGRDDTSEPSWTVLGNLIAETQLVHVQRRARFMAESWGVDASDFIRESRPLYAKHPYGVMIESYAKGRSNPLRDGGMYEAAAKYAWRHQPTPNLAPLFYRFNDAGIKPPNGLPHFFAWADDFHDFTSNDMEWYLTERKVTGHVLRYYIGEIKTTSPYSPVYMAKVIEHLWDESQTQIEEWKKGHGDHPTVAAALARKYSALKDWPEAERYLKAYIEKAPDQWAYHMLAGNYLARGDEGKWLETLKARMEKPDYGLDHAQTNNVIARHYMSQKKYAEALPYAEAGAESYAGWALETAAECHDRLGHKEQAAAIRAAIKERYGK